MRENCLKEFDTHWDCLETNNQDYYRCRKPERTLNTCMFEKLASICASYAVPMSLNSFQGLSKTIPGSPPGKLPIHEVQKPIITGVQK